MAAKRNSAAFNAALSSNKNGVIYTIKSVVIVSYYVLIGLFGFPLVLNLVTLACQQRLNVTWLCFPVVFWIKERPIRT